MPSTPTYLHENTTTTLKPDEVHELGLSEVARIEGEMRAILDANGFAGQPIGEAMDKLAKDPRFLYSNDDKGRADALARIQTLINHRDRALPKQLFLTTPKAKIEVRRVPEFKEATAPGAYYDIRRAMDGTRPGIFFANLRDMNEVPKWSMPTLAYHEGVPGHHWQTLHRAGTHRRSAISQSASVYRVRGRLGALLRMAGETSRLVRQTIHLAISDVFVTNFSARFDWSSIRAFTRNIGRANKRSLTCARKPAWARKKLNPKSSVISSMPGQACAYKIGMLKIQELRERAQKELGEKFDQREFHDAVLKNGGLPLEILEEQVNDYIQRKKG